MGYFKILGKPIPKKSSNYRGLYRSEPFPQYIEKGRFLSLWERYNQYLESNKRGVTTELSFDELKEFLYLATQDIGEPYEVIFFEESLLRPLWGEYLGVDVAGKGGYSMLGEDFFRVVKKKYTALNQHFRARVNENGLFHSEQDAIHFQELLFDLPSSSVEQEDWKIFHLFRV